MLSKLTARSSRAMPPRRPRGGPATEGVPARTAPQAAGHHRPDQPTHCATSVHLAQGPGHSRRAHPALQRLCHPASPWKSTPRLALADAQHRYDDAIGGFPV